MAWHIPISGLLVYAERSKLVPVDLRVGKLRGFRGFNIFTGKLLRLICDAVLLLVEVPQIPPVYDRLAAWHFLTASRSNGLYPGCRKACWLQDPSLVCPVRRGSRVLTSAATSKNDDDDDGTTAADDDGGDGSERDAQDGSLVVPMLATFCTLGGMLILAVQ